MTESTTLDQYLIELINRARMSPAAEAARLGIDVNDGLSPGQISKTPKQPPAFNPALADSVQGHAQWMLDNDVFSHTGVGGGDPADRMAGASELTELDFSSLADHVRDDSALADTWAEMPRWSEEIVTTAINALADDPAHYIDLLGIPHHHHGADGLIGA
jgi:hypothetical protein